MAKTPYKPEPPKKVVPPEPVAKPSGGAVASPKFLWSGHLCVECGEPVAPGQSQVCVKHQKAH